MFSQLSIVWKLLLTVGLIYQSSMAMAVKPVEIKEEKPNYILDIKYPQGFDSDEVNTHIQKYVSKIQQDFMQSLKDDADLPPDLPGKTGLNISYSIPYQANNALSVRLNISIFHKGAAHPANMVEILNFIQGQPVTLAALFKDGSNYLKPIAEYSSKEIAVKNISDANWIAKGTSPTVDNYKQWYFSAKGIDILFDTYQVAAYVFGPQTVEIPMTLISPLLKPGISKLVWGN